MKSPFKLLTFKNWLSLAGLVLRELPMELLTPIVVPIALLFCGKDAQRLPRWARWWDEETTGINGVIYDDDLGIVLFKDGNWLKMHPEPENRKYFTRLRWLLRNRIGVFTTEITGIRFDELALDSLYGEGNEHTPSDGGKSGSSYMFIKGRTKSGKPIFCYFGNFVWCKYFYLRVFIGHKLNDISHIAFADKDKREKLFKHWQNELNQREVAKSVWCAHPLRKIKD